MLETVNIKKSDYLKLFSSCINIKGYARNILYDLMTGRHIFIPHDFSQFLIKTIDIPVLEAYYELNEILKEECFDNIHYLVNNKYAFLTGKKNMECFTRLDLSWHFPLTISNSVLSYNSITKEALYQLSAIGCENLQIRIEDDFLVNAIYIANELIESRIKTIEFITPFSNQVEQAKLKELVYINHRIRRIYFSESPENCYIDFNGAIVCHSSDNLLSVNSCGKIHTEYMSVSIPLFTESQKHNTCLNRKICVDSEGNIKNCPSMKKSYGNIKDTTLTEAIEKEGFKDLWFIHKDKIDVCMDCEFRHMCTDCRAFIKDPDNICSQPAKCPYNPYIAKWEHEDGYITVEEWRKQNPGWEEKRT